MSSSINSQNNRDSNQGILHLWSTFGGLNLNGWWVLTRTSSKWGKFLFEVKFHLEGLGQPPPKTILILTKFFYVYVPNLVTLAWTGDKLSRGQTWRSTCGRMDAGNDNTWRPILASGKNLRLSFNHSAWNSFGKKCVWQCRLQNDSHFLMPQYQCAKV